MLCSTITRTADRMARQVGLRVGSISVMGRISIARQFCIAGAPARKSFQGLPNSIKAFSTTAPLSKGLSPESEYPQPKEAEPQTIASAPVDLTVEKYNQLSNEYLDDLVERLEMMAEEREGIDVEYSAGVLTINMPGNRTYVINKQPPNKQIWFSSPISGPKRYDYVVTGEGQDSKEDTGSGQWIYLRDGSSLNDLLETEVGVDMREDDFH
ncbi:hypothetical protein HYALB_00006998 [Hymenoscyphus albidus]|uniref:ferroxidase n=1 Tax=Hymenoscyphus albidus TaxID=595503 RepID=A0A9N9PZC1_9HELO|nr:hypothetical protein HYALB_00006998 [Hymenoscyphus albidus]